MYKMLHTAYIETILVDDLSLTAMLISILMISFISRYSFSHILNINIKIKKIKNV